MKAKKILEGRSLKSFGVARCYLSLFVMPTSAWTAWTFIFTVIHKFFFSQYFRKFNLTRTPIKYVDHEYDEKIPFRTDFLQTYMAFINHWIYAMSMVIVKFGLWNGTRICAEFLVYMRAAYKNAYEMYRQCMTTTCRPPCNEKKIVALRRADPHFLCVPSLHIAIVVLTYHFFRMLFEREDFTQKEKECWLSEIYEEGMDIARSVLYLKQHSVNCIPAALYMMFKIAPSIFSAEDGIEFLKHFLDKSDDIEDKNLVVGYMEFVFERFLLEGVSEEDWTKPVVRWLKSYESYEPSYMVDRKTSI